MKNLILSFAFILVSITSFAQEKKSEVGTIVTNTGTAIKEGVTAVHQDIKEAVPTLYNDAKTVISQLASAMKVGAEHVYYVLVKQQIVNSITYLISYIIVILIMRFLYIKLREGNKKFDEYKASSKASYYDSRSDQSYIVAPFIGLVATLVVATILVCSTLRETVTGFVNPEYGAITHIIDLINQARQ